MFLDHFRWEFVTHLIITPLSNGKIREKRYNQSHFFYVMPSVKFCPYFRISRSFFGYNSVQKLHNVHTHTHTHTHCDFRKKWAQFKGRKRTIIPFLRFRQIRCNLAYKICTSCCSEIVSSVKIEKKRKHSFLHCSRTVEPYDVFHAKTPWQNPIATSQTTGKPSAFLLPSKHKHTHTHRPIQNK